MLCHCLTLILLFSVRCSEARLQRLSHSTANARSGQSLRPLAVPIIRHLRAPLHQTCRDHCPDFVIFELLFIRMEKGIGTRQSNLKKSFKLAVRSLLTSCSNEEFCKAFPKFTSAEQERLHQLFIQVITSLHENIEDEFESICLESQVRIALDSVEQLVEEQDLDPLFSDKTNVMDVVRDLSTAKKNEIQYLKSMLEKAEEQNCLIRAQVELRKKERQDFSGTTEAVEKLRSGILRYGTCSGNGQQNS